MRRIILSIVIVTTLLSRAQPGSAQKLPAKQWPVSPNSIAQIVIVGIDSKTLYKLGPSGKPGNGEAYKGAFPLDRKWHAQLVATLSKAGAKLIAFDMYFSPEWNSPDSKIFGNVVRKSAVPVIIGFEEIPRDHPHAPRFNMGEYELPRISPAKTYAPSAKALAMPFSEILSAGAILGNLSDHPDPDGVLRNHNLFVSYQNHVLPSLALSIFLNSIGASLSDVYLGGSGGGRWMVVQGKRLPLTGSDAFHVSLPPPSTNFKYMSFYDVVVPKDSFKPTAKALHAEKIKKWFSDKIVIVGFADSSLGDLKRTPAGNAYPGVEVLASTVNQLLNLYTGPHAATPRHSETSASANPSKPPKNTNIDIAVDELKHINK